MADNSEQSDNAPEKKIDGASVRGNIRRGILKLDFELGGAIDPKIHQGPKVHPAELGVEMPGSSYPAIHQPPEPKVHPAALGIEMPPPSESLIHDPPCHEKGELESPVRDLKLKISGSIYLEFE